MYLSSRAAFIRNLMVAIANGTITYIILIIAPLGLMAVFINTFLVMVASFAAATLSDRVILYLQGDRLQQAELINAARRSQLRRQNPTDLDSH
jgi:hypothetical protein